MIDFELDAEQQQLRDVVRRFTEEEIAPRVVGYNRKGEVPEDLVAKVIDLGLVGGGGSFQRSTAVPAWTT